MQLNPHAHHVINIFKNKRRSTSRVSGTDELGTTFAHLSARNTKLPDSVMLPIRGNSEEIAWAEWRHAYAARVRR